MTVQYSFVYNGVCANCVSEQIVKDGLATLFGVSSEKLNPIFDGSATFCREPLDKYTAEAYKEAFEKVGALGQVRELKTQVNSPEAPVEHKIERKQALPSEPVLTADNSTVATDKKEQVEFSKDTQTLSVSTSSNEEKKTKFWLQWSTLAIVVVFIADGYLQDLNTFFTSGIDIGYWPMLIAHFGLVRGCYLLAKLKKLPSIYYGFGFLSIAGLAILLLIPTRTEAATANSKANMPLKPFIVAVFSVLAVVYWFSGNMKNVSTVENFMVESDALALGRNEFPNTTLQSNPELYQQEQDELYSYISEAIQVIANNDLRPNQVEKIGRRFFKEYARYEIWRNYQRYLHFINREELPIPLNKKWTKQDRQRFHFLFEGQITHGIKGRLQDIRLMWQTGGMYGSSEQINLTRLEQSMENNAKTFIAAMHRTSDGLDNTMVPPLNLNTLELHTPKGYRIDAEQHYLTYYPIGESTHKQLQDKALVVAYYHMPGEKISFFRPGVAIISHDFPVEYLAGNFSIFNTYVNGY